MNTEYFLRIWRAQHDPLSEQAYFGISAAGPVHHRATGAAMRKPKQTWEERYCEAGDQSQIPVLKNDQVMIEWWRDGGRRYCLVRCFCGDVRTSAWSNAIHSHSCGCVTNKIIAASRTVHGQTESPTWNTWKSMIERCHWHGHKSFKDYGGRGIIVCGSWHQFLNFLGDMGERPKGTTIGRIDNNKGYYKQNCRWETPSQQARNRRNSRILTDGGRTLTLVEWAEKTGLTFGTIWRRLSKGWSMHDAVTRPAKQQHNSKGTYLT